MDSELTLRVSDGLADCDMRQDNYEWSTLRVVMRLLTRLLIYEVDDGLADRDD